MCVCVCVCGQVNRQYLLQPRLNAVNTLLGVFNLVSGPIFMLKKYPTLLRI